MGKRTGIFALMKVWRSCLLLILGLKDFMREPK